MKTDPEAEQQDPHGYFELAERFMHVILALGLLPAAWMVLDTVAGWLW